MKAVKIIMTDDGQMLAKPCDVDEMDAEGAQPVESMESLPGMIQSLMEQSPEPGEKKQPSMEGEDEFVAGFKGALGERDGY